MMTRKEEVFSYLSDRIGKWVDGSELANEHVGGSEGLRRLRELQEDGHIIESRKHPDTARDVWQYRLIAGKSSPLMWECMKCKKPQEDGAISEHARSLTIADGYAQEYCRNCNSRQIFKRLK